MTIEVRVSYPKGGTECPPGQTCHSLSLSSCPTIASNINTVLEGKLSSGPTSQVDPVNGPPSCGGPVEHFKDPQVQGGNCIAHSARGDSNGNNRTIKPTSKSTVKLDVIQANRRSMEGGNKEETTSRKSRRLRMKREKTDRNSNDLFGTVVKPRYFEDLSQIDFNDSQCRVMFMDALGLSPATNRPPVSYSTSSNSTHDLTALSPSETQGHTTDADTERITSASSSACNTPTVALEPQTNTTHTSPDLRDNGPVPGNRFSEGWHCWMDKLSTTVTCSDMSSPPTKEEINKYLSKLAKLGTSVKVSNVTSRLHT